MYFFSYLQIASPISYMYAGNLAYISTFRDLKIYNLAQSVTF